MRFTANLAAGMAKTMLPAMLGLVLGTALQLQQPDLWSGGAYGVGVLSALILYALAASRNRANGGWGATVMLAVASLGFCATGLRATVFAASALPHTLEGRDVLVTGVVTDLPQRNDAGLRFRLAVQSAELDQLPVVVPERMDVGWYGGVYPTGTELEGLQRQPQDVRPGERWRMLLRLKAPHGSLNPHGFDYELKLWEQGVQATAYVRAGAADPAPQRLGQTWWHPVDLARQTLRERIFLAVADRQLAGMIAALVVGDQSAIDRVDWDVFRATGVAHLVSISGLHITMFAWGAMLGAGWLWRRSAQLCLWWPAPSAALLAGVLLATSYAVFSGWGVPSQRTCIMLATVALLRLSGVRWPWPAVWLLACAVVVACDPWAMLQPGFWLSFVAVGVLFATDSGAPRAHSISTAAIFSMIREQWVITVALAPLTLLLFGQVSLVGLLANAVAIPWITLVVTPLAMVGVVVPWMWDAAAVAVSVLLAVLHWLAALPWATIAVATPPLWTAVAGTLGALVLVFPWSWRMRTLGVPLLLPLLLWRVQVPVAGEFDLLAADIGQGNAVLVRTAGHALLYDAGPRYSLESDAGHRVLVPLLQALHVRLDRVILSHRDIDHVGGAAAVLTMQPQADVLSSIEAGHALQSLRPAQRCMAGQHWEWDGVEFDVLHPDATDYEASAKPNAMSCVLRVSNGRQTALLVGDIEQPQEARLIAQGVALKAQVLLVPHHGSKTSSSADFLDAVQPALALVQAGYRNRFGHPAPVVMDRYRERNIVVLDSPHCGAMEWRSQDADAVACYRQAAQRYWHHRVP